MSLQQLFFKVMKCYGQWMHMRITLKFTNVQASCRYSNLIYNEEN